MNEEFEKALQRINDRSSSEGPVWMLGALLGLMISYLVRTENAAAIKVIIAFVAAISALLFAASTLR